MKLCVFNVKTALFSIVRFAGADRIKEILQVDELPESMHPLLKQKVLPQDTLRNLERQRKRLRDFLLRHATRHPLLGWVTATEKKDLIMERIEAIRTEFLEAKAELLLSYDRIRAEHLEAVQAACGDFPRCAEFVEVVATAQPDRSYVEKQVQFQLLKPRIVELDPEEETMVRDGIYDSVLADLAQAAKETLRLSGVKAQLRAAERMAEKLETLQYIDRRYGIVAGQLRTAIQAVPRGRKEKDYEAGHVLRMNSTFGALMDPDDVALKLKRRVALFGDSPTVANDAHLVLESKLLTHVPLQSEMNGIPGEDLPLAEKLPDHPVEPDPGTDETDEDDGEEAAMVQAGMFAW